MTRNPGSARIWRFRAYWEREAALGLKATLAFCAIMAASQAHADASAVMKESPAKGEKTCVIKQYTSEYLKRQADAASTAAGIKVYVPTSSHIAFQVLSSGRVGIAVSEDTFPGSTQYFMIDGKRFSARSGRVAELDSAAIAALKQDKLIDFTYVDWPYRSEISRKDIFTRFAKAYDECLAFLAGRPKGSRPQADSRPLSLAPKN
jgi:hypothetical protein